MKRNLKQNKVMKKMIKKIDGMLGEQNSGLFLAMICDLLDKLVDGKESAEMRTLEITLNDFFSVKYDFDKEKIIYE